MTQTVMEAARAAYDQQDVYKRQDQYLVKDTARMEIRGMNQTGQETVMRTQSTTLKTKQGPVDKAALKKMTAALKDIRDVQLTDTGEDQLKKLDEILERMGGNL